MFNNFKIVAPMSETSWSLNAGGVRLDLHGYSVQDAREYITDLIKNMHPNDNCFMIHLITGRGKHVNSSGEKGVLFKNLEKWVKEPEIIGLVKEVKKNLGAYVIILNKKNNSSKHESNYRLIPEILRKFANRGNKFAQFELGHYLFEKNDKECYTWFLKAAQQELDEAMLMIGYLHAMGICAQYSAQKAIHWYSKASLSSTNACINLGVMYWSGEAGKVDLEQAVYWFKRAEKLGSIKAQRLLGIVLRKQGRYEEAVIWDAKASANNDHCAQVNLGCMYQIGLGVAKDQKKAVELLQKAVAGGVPEGKMRLGLAYLNGEGVNKDYKMAGKLFLEVGLSNNDSVGADCQFLLANMYENGHGFITNMEIAQKWLKRAAYNKHKKAISMLEKNDIFEVDGPHCDADSVKQTPEWVWELVNLSDESLELPSRMPEETQHLALVEHKFVENRPAALLTYKYKEAHQKQSVINTSAAKQGTITSINEEEKINIKDSNTVKVKKETGYHPYFSQYVLLSGVAVTVAVCAYVRRNYLGAF